jgi:hypothetical protein
MARHVGRRHPACPNPWTTASPASVYADVDSTAGPRDGLTRWPDPVGQTRRIKVFRWDVRTDEGTARVRQITAVIV